MRPGAKWNAMVLICETVAERVFWREALTFVGCMLFVQCGARLANMDHTLKPKTAYSMHIDALVDVPQVCEVRE